MRFVKFETTTGRAVHVNPAAVAFLRDAGDAATSIVFGQHVGLVDELRVVGDVAQTIAALGDPPPRLISIDQPPSSSAKADSQAARSTARPAKSPKTPGASG
jgi:hypothetical protein